MGHLTIPCARSLRIAVAAGLGVFSVPLLLLMLLPGLTVRRTPGPTSVVARLPKAPPPSTPAEAALREAAGYRNRARQDVKREMEALEAWDPTASAGIDWDAWRLQELARDKNGHLRRSRELLDQAAVLARTPDEARRVLVAQILLDHEAGRHEQEIRRARTLRATAPDDDRTRGILRRVQHCSGSAAE